MYKNLLEHFPEHDNDIFNDAEIESEKINIDEVFINITNIYEPTIISIIYNTLLLIKSEDDPVIINNYICGLNHIMTKNNRMIKEWIKVNLIF